MGSEILALLSLAVLLPLVVLGWSVTNREQRFIEDTWQTYAARREREYVPARGEWPNRTSPAVRWRSNNLRFRLSVVDLDSGARTRLVTWPHERLLGEFVIGPKDTVGSTETKHAPSPAKIREAFFACVFAVSESHRGLAARVLDDRARRGLLGFWQGHDLQLRYRRGKLILEWPGRESNEARIDEAEQVLRELARGVDDAFHQRAGAREQLLT